MTLPRAVCPNCERELAHIDGEFRWHIKKVSCEEDRPVAYVEPPRVERVSGQMLVRWPERVKGHPNLPT
jgi:hypothetical protein